MSLSPLVSFKSRFVTYLLNFPRISFLVTDLLLQFTFRGPCIVIYSYNKNQRDALFLNFISIKDSICFGQIYCPSSGVSTLYIQQQVFVLLFMWTVC